MNLIKRKLRSKRGASMIIAMVFMMFCIFIGGSVLASASANGYRVAHLSDQQDYLEQRSAAMLLAAELEGSHYLNIEDETKTVYKINLAADGSYTYVGGAEVYRTITFKAPSGLTMTALQRLMYETAVWQYLVNEGVTDVTKVSIVLEGFPVTDWKTFSLYNGASVDTNGTVKITCSESGTDMTAAYGIDNGYDFTFSFGEYGQMTVIMDGASGTNARPTRTEIAKWKPAGAAAYDAEITTQLKKPTISWGEVNIRKGGA